MHWFPLYTKEWAASVGHMSAAQRGIYISLLVFQWDNGSVPDCIEQCARIAGAMQMQEGDWLIIRDKFKRSDEDGRLRNAKLESVRSTQVEKAEAVSNNARRAAAARHKRPEPCARTAPAMPTQCASNARALPTQCHSESESESESKRIKTPPTPLARDAMRRLLLREPAWRTRVERAGAGDWYVKGEDGQQRLVTEDEVIADGIAVMTAKVEQERELTLAKLRTNGLSDGDSELLYRRWLAEYLDGGPSPATVVRNDLADKSVRNIAAVWRARLAAPYNPGHGTQAQVVGEAGAAGGPR
jgi:uncharacterized protein YdaU (DUF1376 family)